MGTWGRLCRYCEWDDTSMWEKLRSSARGGMTFAIQRELDLPILYAGLGEKMDDLETFDPDAFVAGIMAEVQS